ncbi:MAG: T9SS type A sorting domain-containing protein [Salibacteraceae bacterium]
MKIYSIQLISFFVALSSALSAQNLHQVWEKQFNRSNKAGSNHSYITTLDSNLYLAMQEGNYLEFNDAGDSIRSGSTKGVLQYVEALEADNSSIYIGGGDLDSAQVAKLDKDYNQVWIKTVQRGGFKTEVRSIMIDSGNVYTCGTYSNQNPFITKLSANGDSLWSIVINKNIFSSFSNMKKLSDGNFLATGNTDDYPLVVKFNSQGDTIWTYTDFGFISFNRTNIHEFSNGEIFVLFQTKGITFSALGKNISDLSLSQQFSDMLVSNDSIYMFGRETSKRYPYVEVHSIGANNSISLIGGKTFSNYLIQDQTNGFDGVTECLGGGFVAGGMVRDSFNLPAFSKIYRAVKFNGNIHMQDTTSKPSGVFEFNSGGDDLTIFPNPSKGMVKIMEQDARLISVINALGTKVPVEFTQNLEFDLKQLPNGIYWFMFEYKGRIVSSKVVLNKEGL